MIPVAEEMSTIEQLLVATLTALLGTVKAPRPEAGVDVEFVLVWHTFLA